MSLLTQIGIPHSYTGNVLVFLCPNRFACFFYHLGITSYVINILNRQVSSENYFVNFFLKRLPGHNLAHLTCVFGSATPKCKICVFVFLVFIRFGRGFHQPCLTLGPELALVLHLVIVLLCCSRLSKHIPQVCYLLWKTAAMPTLAEVGERSILVSIGRLLLLIAAACRSHRFSL